MKRFSKLIIAVALFALAAGSALATPVPSTAVVIPRVFNDAPFSVLVVDNSYPSLIEISDTCVVPAGWANLHVWRFSNDGVSALDFLNGDGFAISADVKISGTANGEAGMQIAPWWSEADGRFNIRTPDGEVAVFGGRLPFYSFTANHGKSYVKDTWVRLSMVYRPTNQMNATNPATIEYIYDDGSPVSSGELPFDEGNPSEDPPHGLWGLLNPAHAGGYMQFNNMSGSADLTLVGSWSEISFQDLGTVVANEESTWGGVKALFR
ncbi:MAG: hypothetical protein IPK64_03980 [bacterium]|nr:hypothetical protein [bacterium]